MSLVIGFVGGPSAGKSTAAAEYYSFIKKSNRSVGLVTELVQDPILRGDTIYRHDQLLWTAKQICAEATMLGKYEYVVTDSTPLQYTMYGRHFGGSFYGQAVEGMVRAYLTESRRQGHRHIYFSVPRLHRFDPLGRAVTEKQAKEMDTEVLDILKRWEVDWLPLSEIDEFLEKEIRCRGQW